MNVATAPRVRTDSRDLSRGDVAELFFALEEDLELFNRRIAGTHFWDHLRVPLSQAVGRELGLHGELQAEPDRRVRAYLRSAGSIARSIVGRAPFLARPADLVFIGHPRRQELDGEWWDLYCDPVIEDAVEPLGLTSLLLERPFLNRHCEPARTRRLYHLDALAAAAALGRRLKPLVLDRTARGLLSEIERALREQCGVSVDVRALATRELALRQSQFGLYRCLFRRLRPRLVVLVVSYGNETIVAACRSLGIPTIELQHGLMASSHLGYAFPDARRRKHSFPDHFFSFGDFWARTVPLPLPPDRIWNVGYPHLDREREKLRHETRRPQVVFLSQRPIGRELSRCAARLATESRLEERVVYKLHPGEYASWRSEYPWLVEAPIEVIAGDATPLYPLLARSTIQVGVYSTAVYEGLAFGLRTVLVDLPGIEFMQPLLAHDPEIPRISGVTDLVAAIRASHQRPAPGGEVFFRPGAADNVRRALKAILAEVSPASR